MGIADARSSRQVAWFSPLRCSASGDGSTCEVTTIEESLE